MSLDWRRLHFVCTVIAGVFLLVASITGCILAVEPWYLRTQSVSGAIPDTLTLNAFRQQLDEHFLEVFEVKQDAYGNFQVEGIGMEADGTLYVEAATGRIVEAPAPLPALFDFSRDLHRSLFLKTPGRLLVGLASLSLVVLVISGVGLHLKRAGGWRKIVQKINVLHLQRDGHAQWSRVFALPILLIALTGVYLSFDRFVPETTVGAERPASMQIDEILLRDIQKVSYPIEEGEPLHIELTDRTLWVDPTGDQAAKEVPRSVRAQLQTWSFILHTGQNTPVWAGVLLLCSLVLVFLSFTGFGMVAAAWKRKSPPTQLTEWPEVLILVGSETGHTWRFADALEAAYQQAGVRAGTLAMEHLPTLGANSPLVLFLTSTYGDGDAPSNASTLMEQLEAKLSTATSLRFGVLGFGASQYPAFCAFAAKLRDKLSSLPNTEEVVPYGTVDNQSVVQFMDWVKVLSKRQATALYLDTKRLHPTRKKGLQSFRVLDKEERGDTFLMRVTFEQELVVRSGDLLAVYPPEEAIERYYSIAYLGRKELILVIKRTGLCSCYLGDLSIGEVFGGYLKANPSFYRTDLTRPTLFIANGTGIAPFLGMASANSILYWGGRHRTDFEPFAPYFTEGSRRLAFSREQAEASYVQEFLMKHPQELDNLLRAGGTIMICGSLSMLRGVLATLDELWQTNGSDWSVPALSAEGRLLSDCY